VTTRRLILASASPARLRTLAAAGIRAEAIVSGVDESTVDSGNAAELCLVLARMKARAVADRVEPPALVLGCDSVLAFDGRILGKPVDADEARQRWYAMRGRSGVLHTGHSIVDTTNDRTAEATASTTVHFADVTDEEIDAYIATGEPLAVAGAFTIDGIGGPFIERIEGDAGTVIGLSLPLLRRLLAQLGIPIVTLWQNG